MGASSSSGQLDEPVAFVPDPAEPWYTSASELRGSERLKAKWTKKKGSIWVDQGMNLGLALVVLLDDMFDDVTTPQVGPPCASLPAALPPDRRVRRARLLSAGI